MDLETSAFCSLCGKELDDWDIHNDVHIHKRLGYGSIHDGAMLDLRLCCDCLDKLIYMCRVSPIMDGGELHE